MNIGPDGVPPTFAMDRRTAVAAGVSCHTVVWQPVRVVKLVDTLRCERRAFGHAGSNPAAHTGRALLLSHTSYFCIFVVRSQRRHEGTATRDRDKPGLFFLPP
jgi:hypothetical protein